MTEEIFPAHPGHSQSAKPSVVIPISGQKSSNILKCVRAHHLYNLQLPGPFSLPVKGMRALFRIMWMLGAGHWQQPGFSNNTNLWRSLAQQVQSPNSNTAPARVVWENCFLQWTLLSRCSKTSRSKLRRSKR